MTYKIVPVVLIYNEKGELCPPNGGDNHWTQKIMVEREAEIKSGKIDSDSYQNKYDFLKALDLALCALDEANDRIHHGREE